MILIAKLGKAREDGPVGLIVNLTDNDSLLQVGVFFKPDEAEALARNLLHLAAQARSKVDVVSRMPQALPGKA